MKFSSEKGVKSLLQINGIMVDSQQVLDLSQQSKILHNTNLRL